MIRYSYYESPTGLLGIAANDEGVCGILSRDNFDGFIRPYQDVYVNDSYPLIQRCKQELDLYFAGKLKSFSVPLSAKGTPFQMNAWEALLKIPYGKTVSYGEQACLLGNPKASRAVGAANGKNPISIIIPCHRVIGKDGSLTGYAGGIKMKEFLLNLEASS